MELSVIIPGVILLLIAAVFLFGPRPVLNATVPASQVPDDLEPQALARWLQTREQDHGSVVDGAEAGIIWADEPGVTDLCFLYIHGFSATRQETAPLTERVADHFRANVVHTRLAGHGLLANAMEASAEDWLQSMVDSWHIAARIGRKVVVIATSTGAPLAVWLNEHVAARDRIHAFIFLSPNFRIRNPFGFLLTWPWAQAWVPYLLGREHSWEPETEMAAKYWSHRYGTSAVIEMQKIVDWAGRLKPTAAGLPLATLYMEGDPTINHEAAVSFHERWDADIKRLHRVTIDEHLPQHVFVGDIYAPQRVDWCVQACIEFIESVPDTAPPA